MSDMRENSPEAVWEIIGKIGTSMFITRDGDNLEGRPLQAYPDEDAGLIYFMTDAENVIAQTATDSRVMLSFANTGGNDYVAIDGNAAVTNDRAKIRELWTVWAKAFWDSPDDPKIRIIVFTPDHARYWDAPNTLVTTMAMVASAITGKKPKLGDVGEVDL